MRCRGWARRASPRLPRALGRPADQVTVCLPDGALSGLGATEIIGRNFRRDHVFDGSTNPPE